MTCARHPSAGALGELCAACLLEQALEPRVQDKHTSAYRLSIHVPLGETPSARVFLVKADHPAQFLRLKVWRRPAPPGFLRRFQQLQGELQAWEENAVMRPLAASLDAAGRPLVLTEFSRGLPILDRVRSGRLDPDRAVALLRPVLAALQDARARRLVHGSVVPGNVVVDADRGRAVLLDFGLTPLVDPTHATGPLESGDLAGFADLEGMLLGDAIHPASRRL